MVNQMKEIWTHQCRRYDLKEAAGLRGSGRTRVRGWVGWMTSPTSRPFYSHQNVSLRIYPPTIERCGTPFAAAVTF